MPKKKKTSKETLEAERRAREEEERRAKEAEEKRIEDEKRKEQENARRELNDRIKLRNEEINRFIKEEEEYLKIKSAFDSELVEEKRRIADSVDWDEFVSCSDNFGIHDNLQIRLNEFLSKDSINEPSTIDNIVIFADQSKRFIRLLISQLLDGLYKNNMLIEFQPRFLSTLREKVKEVTNKILAGSLRHSSTTVSDGDNACCFYISASDKSGIVIFELKGKKQNKFRKDNMLLNELGLSLDFPKSMISQKGIIVRICKVSYDIRSYERYCGIDSNFIPLGFIYIVETVVRSTMAKKLNGITICQSLEDMTMPVSEQKGTFKYQLSVPKQIIISDRTKIGTWDDEQKHWSENKTSHAKFDMDKELFTFHLSSPCATIALIQPKILDFPYKKWCIRPKLNLSCTCKNISCMNENIIEYLLDTPRFEILFIVKGATCKLVSPKIPQLEHIIDKEYEPSLLLSMMSESGIHLLPNKLAETKHIVSSKSEVIEQRFVQEVVNLCPAFSIEGNKYNSKLGINHACFQIHESNSLTGNIGVDEFQLFFMELDNCSSRVVRAPGANNIPDSLGRVRCSILKDTRSWEDLLEKNRQTECSLHGIFLVKEYCSSEAMNRIRSSNQLIKTTMSKLISLTQPLTFTEL